MALALDSCLQKYNREALNLVATLRQQYPDSRADQICEACEWDWQKAGKKADEKPPLFPVEYDGRCPCGGKFRRVGCF